MESPNNTMLCDFYELTMANGYYVLGKGQEIAYFDVFFRQIPDGGGFAIAAGLEQVISYIRDLHFTDEDIAFLRTKGCFDEGFLSYLREFRFTGDIYAVPEGTPIFPGEPILTVRAPAIEAQFVETYILLALNHQSLIATKANRIVRAADGRAVAEFGSRAGGRRRFPRGAGGVYRRLFFHRLHDQRPRLRHSRLGNHGAFLGADVRFGIRSLPGLLQPLPR